MDLVQKSIAIVGHFFKQLQIYGTYEKHWKRERGGGEGERKGESERQKKQTKLFSVASLLILIE